jgi:hypothetical protein
MGNYGNFPALNRLNFIGDMNTTPGATYEISFTLQDASFSGDFDGAGDVSFGNCEVNLDSAFEDGYMTTNGYLFPPVNYDFTAVADSSTTSMSFDFLLDEGLNADLSNLDIMEVPEPSATRVLYCSGCLMLLARQWRKLTQKQKLAIKTKV